MSRYIVDANIVIYMANLASPHHGEAAAAVRKLRAAAEELFITPQVIIEFWNTATGTGPTGLSWTVAMASAALIQHTSSTGMFRWLPDPVNVFEEWYKLCIKRQITDPKCYDARIVALMDIYGIDRILTKNVKQVAPFTNIQAVDPGTV
jgi:predicted nucleic acid-binding protein